MPQANERIPADRKERAALKKAHHAMMREAAKTALALSVWPDVNIHVFGAAYMTKMPLSGSNGSLDARGNFDKNGKVQTNFALLPWDGNLALNPSIRLDFSGLTAVDVDHGLEGLTDEEIILKAEANGLPRTYTTRTGRPNGGATFFYIGVRDKEHPDVLGYKIGGQLSGDIKCHGHVAAAGSIYRFKDADGKPTDEFTFYRCINQIPFTRLPTYLRDHKYINWNNPKSLTKLAREVSTFDADWKKRGETEPMLVKTYSYKEQVHADLVSGKKVIVRAGELVPRGGRFKYLVRQAGHMRAQGLDPEIIRIALDLRAARKCQDGRNFIISHKNDLDVIAGWSETQWKEGDYVMRKLPDLFGGSYEERQPFTRHDYLARALRTCPQQTMTSKEIFQLLKAALSGTKFKLKKGASRSEEAIREAREETGWTVSDRTGGIQRWTRSRA